MSRNLKRKIVIIQAKGYRNLTVKNQKVSPKINNLQIRYHITTSLRPVVMVIADSQLPKAHQKIKFQKVKVNRKVDKSRIIELQIVQVIVIE